jgi:hypothetical protein
LTLKADALAGLNLPIAVAEGVLEELTFKVPYTLAILTKLIGGGDLSAIQMKPIELKLSRVRVVVKPLESLEAATVDAKKVVL